MRAHPKKRKLAFRKKKKNRVSLLVIAAVGVLSVGLVTYNSISLTKEKDSIEKDIEAINKNISQEEKRTKELKEYEIYTHTKKYAEDVAKDVLGYVYEDEIVFKPDND